MDQGIHILYTTPSNQKRMENNNLHHPNHIQLCCLCHHTVHHLYIVACIVDMHKNLAGVGPRVKILCFLAPLDSQLSSPESGWNNNQ